MTPMAGQRNPPFIRAETGQADEDDVGMVAGSSLTRGTLRSTGVGELVKGTAVAGAAVKAETVGESVLASSMTS